MTSGIEFHVEAPSYMKLFFILFEHGLGKRNVFELSRRLCCSDSFLKLNNLLREAGPLPCRILNMRRPSEKVSSSLLTPDEGPLLETSIFPLSFQVVREPLPFAYLNLEIYTIIHFLVLCTLKHNISLIDPGLSHFQDLETHNLLTSCHFPSITNCWNLVEYPNSCSSIGCLRIVKII